MIEAAQKMVWLRLVLKDLGISSPSPIHMHCDNQVIIFIAYNFTFHMLTKHIEIDSHYTWDKVMSKVISTPHMTSSHKLADVFLNSLSGIFYDAMCTKLVMFDLYALP